VSTVVGGRLHTRLVRSCESSQRAARARIALDEIGQRSGDRTLVGLIGLRESVQRDESRYVLPARRRFPRPTHARRSGRRLCRRGRIRPEAAHPSDLGSHIFAELLTEVRTGRDR
jgi:hypothetical protein